MPSTSNLVRISVVVEGLPPGLLFQGKGLMEVASTKAGKPLPPEEEAKLRAHWVTVGKKKLLGIPWVMFYRSICKAGAKFKATGKRTMESLLAPTLSCEQDVLSLGIDQFETMVEYCRIPPRTGPMVKIGRPLIRQWSCTIPITADCEDWNPEHLEKVIVEAGKYVGIGAWRPQLKGPHGRFTIKQFTIE